MRHPSSPAAGTVRPPSRAAAASVALAVLAAAISPPQAAAGPTDNVILRARLDEHSGYSDIWGHTAPDGREYALLGTHTGLAVINVSDPAAPYETGFLAGPTTEWRDIKTLGPYAYVVNEANGGMAIVDLGDPEHPQAAANYAEGGLVRAHNLFIDVKTARAYVFGYNGTGGFLVLDLSNPVAPVELARWDVAYVHDGMVFANRLYACCINDPRLRVLDVANPAAITELGTAEGYPNAYTHNAWVTSDGAHVMTTDETAASSCRMWDLSTLPNLVQTDFYRPAPNVIPHNTQIDGDFAFISYYTLGVKIVDVSDPSSLVEVGSFDTWPGDGSNFDGCWGVFPWFQTNPDLLVASDIHNGLYVLEYKGTLGTLAGTVTEAGAGTPVPGALVELVADELSVAADSAGTYALQGVPGSVDVRVSRYGYETRTIPVTLVAGATTPLDVELEPLPRGSLSGVVTVLGSGAPIAGARLELVGTPLADTTDAAGAYVLDPVPVGTHVACAFAFGSNPSKGDVVVTEGNGTIADFALGPAPYFQDFESPTSSGWSVSGTAERGTWELADPQGTYSDGVPIQPEDDHTPPPGTKCWVTDARAGGGPGNWDVDNGETVLQSTIIATFGMANPHVRYYRWYSSGVGNPNTDPFLVEMSTNAGVTWPFVLENTSVSTNAWIEVDLALNDFVPPPGALRFRFTAQDTGNGGIIEAALDDFMLYEGFEPTDGTYVPLPPLPTHGFRLGTAWPNPCPDGQEMHLELLLWEEDRVSATVFDVAGRRVATLFDRQFEAGLHTIGWSGRLDAGRRAAAGVYFLRVRGAGESRTRKLLLIR